MEHHYLINITGHLNTILGQSILVKYTQYYNIASCNVYTNYLLVYVTNITQTAKAIKFQMRN